MKRLTATAIALALVPAAAAAGCSANAGPAASTPAPPRYDSFEKIGASVGCLSMSKADPETTDIKNNKYCLLEQPAQPQSSVTVYEFADLARRDKSLRAGIVQGQSFLVLSDTWSLSGDVQDLTNIHTALGAGELRSVKPEKPASAGTVGAADDEAMHGPHEPEVIPLGKSVTYNDERVQVSKVYCNTLGGEGRSDKQFDSCRKSSYRDQYDTLVQAPKGDVLFIVAVRWKNVGKKPIQPTGFGTLVTADDVEYELNDVSQAASPVTPGATTTSTSTV